MPIDSSVINTLTSINSLGCSCPADSPLDIMEQARSSQLGSGIGVRLLRNNHNSMSYAVVSIFDSLPN